MVLEPSGWKGLRIGLRLDAAQRALTTPGFGWLLIAIGLVIGFAVGSRIVAVPAQSGERAAIADVSSEPRRDGIAEVAEIADVEMPVASDPVRNAVGAAVATAAEAGDGDYTLASHKLSVTVDPERTRPRMAEAQEVGTHYAEVPIQGLPLHHAGQEIGPADALTIVTRGEIRRGESLGTSLRRQGISPGTVHLIATEMRKVFDFRRSRPGDEYRLGQDSEGRVLDFRYSQDAEESFYLGWEGTRYVVRKETAELRPQIAKIAGIVDSSFYGAILALGEQSALASDFARILAWDIDFSRNVHPGDEFSILYERLYRRNDEGEEVYVRPGRILAGRYHGNVGHHTVVYFEDETGVGAYFRPDGSSVERAFLAAPLEFSRISSRFTSARRHPILDVTRPHPGIDYAAPHGTPIWAVAEGVVEYKARAGASGNLIRIRHKGGYTSHYAHLSGFAKHLDVGDRVEQKQIIGFVGSTGLSTGPHVCFRVKQNGRYVDPMKISSPAGSPVEHDLLDDFNNVRDELLADLGPGPISVADEAL